MEQLIGLIGSGGMVLLALKCFNGAAQASTEGLHFSIVFILIAAGIGLIVAAISLFAEVFGGG